MYTYPRFIWSRDTWCIAHVVCDISVCIPILSFNWSRGIWCIGRVICDVPVCIPILSFNWSLGLWRILKDKTALRRAIDIRAISRACRFPFLCGKPETTMYASPIVSTWKYIRATSREILSSELFDQGKLKSACSDTCTRTSESLGISDIVQVGAILSRQRTIKLQIRLRGCTGWSAPLLFAYGIRHVFS